MNMTVKLSKFKYFVVYPEGPVHEIAPYRDHPGTYSYCGLGVRVRIRVFKEPPGGEMCKSCTANKKTFAVRTRQDG